MAPLELLADELSQLQSLAESRTVPHSTGQRGRFNVHDTPADASWLNKIERWFGFITQRAILRGSFSSVKELIAKIGPFVAAYNKTTAPFNWTATAD